MNTTPINELTEPAEIKANRQGAISDAQRKLIITATDFKAWAIAAAALAVLSVISIFCLSEMGSGNAGSILGIVLGGCLLFCLWRGLRMWTLRRKLLSSQIISPPGEVVYLENLLDPHQYIVKNNAGERINPVGLGGVGVSGVRPGPYNVYYLPIQRWLLSLEPTASEAEYNSILVQVLAKANHFSVEDLARYKQPGILEQEGIQTLEGQVMAGMFTDEGVGEGDLLEVVLDGASLTFSKYYYEIEGKKLKIYRPGYGALIPGLKYRVYYKGDKLKAIEPVG
jgi:hypothetical protein